MIPQSHPESSREWLHLASVRGAVSFRNPALDMTRKTALGSRQSSESFGQVTA